ncbi:MAG: DNA polymerase I [Deltaproteobacteria bacterium]|nr:DNA polymerase I [Deltaproteobacteria bacterium]
MALAEQTAVSAGGDIGTIARSSPTAAPASFPRVWAVDFEYVARSGEQPRPVCVVARELGSGLEESIWLADGSGPRPRYVDDHESLFVAYFAPAELSCHLALGWPLPKNVLDLFVEFRAAQNGRQPVAGFGLLGALTHYGLPALDAVEKDEMRALILRGGPYSPEEREAILAYCKTDVVALERLLPKMAPAFDVPRALNRGRYQRAVAEMEHTGVPIDTTVLQQLETSWDDVRVQLIERSDVAYGVYEGTRFCTNRFASYLEREGIAWPRTPAGNLVLDKDTFKEQARIHPQLKILKELRVTLSQMKLSDLAVGSDGRNRCMLSPFSSRTGRNQPSTSRFIFGPSAWLRSLIKPGSGKAVASIDWSQQEFGIPAVLSGDDAMREAYVSGDPYISFAKLAGAVPSDATKRTYPEIREQYKACVLGVQFGMGARGLARRLNTSEAVARQLLEQHRRSFPKFWAWSDAAVDYAMLRGRIHTVFGWPLYVGSDPNPRMLRNFPTQANGAEMLRLACCFATEAGVRVCAPIHDALLIEADSDDIEGAVERTQMAMAEASRAVLDGFELRTDATIVRYPDRYVDERGVEMWNTVMAILADLEQQAD